MLKGKLYLSSKIDFDSSIANLNEVKNYIVNNKFESNNLAERIDNCFNEYTIDSENSLATKEDIKKMLKK